MGISKECRLQYMYFNVYIEISVEVKCRRRPMV